MSERREPGYDGSEIAVVGMAGRFPGAGDLNAFWRNLETGVESIAVFSEEEVRQAGEEPKLLANPDYVRARPILDGVEFFDAAFFGFSPKEAEILDPQLRLFLECAWTALEHAGHDPERLPGRASLFAGASFSNYLVRNLYKNRPTMEAFGDLQATIYNVHDSLVTMVGYKLNLKGACCAVQTFCSTSLVGVHLACQNLLNYESDLALAGGVTVYVPQRSGYLYQEGSIVSRDGHCRAFDARADGTVFGNGLGVVVLRRLEDARKDGNTIQAVIRGSAVNGDGSLKASFAAPGVVGQTEVVVEALSAAEVDPSTIQYVEAHGTGTRLGDPAEVSALTKAFRTRTDRTGFCALGSVKTNVGHLDAASGVAGLLKVILSLQHGRIPPILHFETPNPAIDFARSPFYVNTSLREWPRGATPRRAGVSAFGVGGTNAHVIVEEAPATTTDPSARRHQLLVLSAKTAEALDAAALRLAAHLEAHAELELSDVAYTLQLGRSAFAHRRIVAASGLAEAVAALRSAGPSLTAICERRNPPLVLVLAGQGRIAVDAWRELYEGEEGFREAVTRCVEAASEQVRRTLEALCAGGAESESALVDPDLEPLAIFAAEYALARLWKSWGLRFEAVIGDGVGKLVAACLDGTMEVEAVGLLAARTGSPEVADRARAEGRDARPVPRPLPADADRLYLEVGGCPTLGLAAGLSAGKLKAGVATEGPPIGYRELLVLLGRLWLAGVEVDWAALHVPERRRRVPLPAYPFERKRFWVEPLKEAPAQEPSSAACLYRSVWKTAMPAAGGSVMPARSLVFVDSTGLGARIMEHLRKSGAEVVTVLPGRSFAGDPTTGYSLDPAQDGHYALLWDDLRSRQQIPDRVIHLWSLEPLDPGTPGPDRFRRGSDLGFYSLLQLARTRPPAPLALHVVSSGLYEVIGGEALAPEKAPIVALCRVLAQEEHDLQCALIDVEPLGDAEVGLSELLLAELQLPSREPVVAHRRGRRWVQDYEPIPGAAGGSGPWEDHRVAPIREGGVYLITGGLGNVGFVLGASLARQGRAKLVLTGRTSLPPRERWSEWLADHEGGEPTALRIQKVQALEALGAEVLVFEADAVSAEDMRAAVFAAQDRFGGLQGVIHAAGELAADTFLPVRGLGRGACERQFAPKVHGLFALDEALAGLPLDFCLLTSSLSSVLGGVGYAAYAGANAFMDGFAARKCQEGSPTWVSVNWDQWEFGLPVEPGSARRAARKGSTLRPEEGLRAFEHILRLRGLDRVVVSAGPLAARLERWVSPTAPSDDHKPAAGPPPCPALRSAYLSPRNETERVLAGIWEELLGIERVGIHDNFFELGGHSLFAARALSRLREAFGVSLPLDAFFDAPTVAELAARVTAVARAREAPAGARPEPAGDRVEIEL